MSQHNISRMPYEDLKINITPTQHSPMMQVQKIPEDKSTLNSSAGIEENQASVFIMAGAAAGIMEHCIMYPVDSVKVIYLLIASQQMQITFFMLLKQILSPPPHRNKQYQSGRNINQKLNKRYAPVLHFN